MQIAVYMWVCLKSKLNEVSTYMAQVGSNNWRSQGPNDDAFMEDELYLHSIALLNVNTTGR